MKIISFIYKRKVIKKILIHLNVYEERKNQRAPPQIKKENTKPVVEIVPYDDGWQEYDEPVFDLNKFKYCKGISVFELRVIGRKR